MTENRYLLNAQLAQMLKGGVIMDVVNVEQAQIAQEAGAVAVMALERVPADIRKQGGVARMSDPGLIKAIKEAVTIPVMAKARIGHFVEAQILQALKIDYIDESEVLTPADEECHIDKTRFAIPFVCGARNLGEAAAPDRRGRGDDSHQGRGRYRQRGGSGAPHADHEPGDPSTGGHAEPKKSWVSPRPTAFPTNWRWKSKNWGGCRWSILRLAASPRRPTPRLMMQLGCDGVFVGSGIFKSADPVRRARAIVKATAFYNDPEKLLEVSMDLGDPMPGQSVTSMPGEERLAGRGW
jgi:pyridoxal 5'-phosphate synthase pdxS subunit